MIKEIFLVGGAVRDQLMGNTPKDLDYLAVGWTPQEFLDIGYSQVGKDFPVFLDPDTKHEYALARTDRKMSAGYQGFLVDVHGITLEQDLLRRDLTINSIAKSQDGTLYDPYNGQQDIKDKFLRHTSDAFKEDPVRVLRLARFQAQFLDFRIHKTTKVLVYGMQDELKSLQPDRVWQETRKALKLPNAHRYFEALHEMGVLETIFPHIYLLTTLKEGNKHHLEASVFEHTMQMMKLNPNVDITLKLAILFHDIAKPHTYRTFGDSAGHESEELVAPRIKETLNLPTKLFNDTVFLTKNHVKIYKLPEMLPKNIATFFAQYKQPYLMDLQIQLGQTDDEGRITLKEKKDIDPIKIWKCFWPIHKYSPAEWIKARPIIPTGLSIKNQIHHHNIQIVKEHYGKNS